MFAFTRIRTSVARLTVGALAISLLSAVGVISGASTAQAATTVYINDTDAPLAFVKTNSVNIVGSGGTAVNNVVLYKTVGTYGGVAIDAVVTTLSVSGSITNYDSPGSASTAAGYLNNWMINTTGGEARFRFEFFRAGTYTGANTGIPVVLQNVKVTSIDLDCSSSAGSYQYTDATGFQKYSMMSPTNLAVQSLASPARVRFIANKTGSRSSVPEDQVMLKYDAIQTVEFSFGNVIAGSTNWFGLVFGGWPNGGTPVEYTNQYNAPPTSTDTTINASGATLLSLANFGTYADADNNPFFSVKLAAPSPDGTLEYWNGSAWATASAGQVVTTADIEKGYLRFTPGAGNSTISFNVNDGLEFSTAANTLTITKVTNSQTITFANPGTKGTGSGAFPSGATTSAPLVVVLRSLTPGICTVAPPSLDITPVGAGTCVIVATQPGDSTYGAAAEVTQEFQIISGSAPTETQTITFNNPGTQNLDSQTVATGASSLATNGTSLTPTLTSNTPSICTINGLTINLVAAGTCTVTASQPGTSVIAPAVNVVRSFTINAVAGGGTAPGVRTTGPKFTASDAVTLTGRLDTNANTTTWQFCYKQTDRPSVSNGILGGSPTCLSSANLSDNGSANREVTANLSSLSSGNYYYQLVGWHSGGAKVYGVIWKFIAKSYPYIRTTDASNITETTARLNGSVQTKSDKEYSITICYSKEYKVATDYSGKLTNCLATKQTSPSKVKSNSFVDVQLNVSGLDASTTYYYQVIAERSKTKTYGNIVQFITSSPAPIAVTGSATGFTSTGVTVNGSIAPNGNSVTPKFCVTETFTATTLNSSHCLTGALVTASPSTATGTGSVSIQYTASGLTIGKVYYYQAFGVYGSSSTVSGTIKSFTFGAPVATTQAATDVKITSGSLWEAVLRGYINPNGFTSENFFRYSDTNTVTSAGQLDSSTVVVANPNTSTARGAIDLSLGGLTAGQTYYFQAVGKNATGALYSYGEVLSFITAYAPSVTTEDVLLFGVDTATVRGTLNANGALTTGSFCISTSNATTAIDGVLDSCLFVLPTSPTTTSGSTDITGAAVGLSQATTYYYQAIGDNSQGTSYGTIKSFTTLAGAPVATTVAASNVLSNNATLNGRVNPGGAATTVKFCYHTSNSVDGAGKITSCTLTSTIATVGATAGLTSLSFGVESLTANTTYYFQVVASNTVSGSTNTIYGAVLSFKTGAPIVKTLPATSVTGTTAVLNGTAKANGSNVSSVTFCLATDPTLSGTGAIANCTSTPNATPASFASTITIDNPESASVSSLTQGTLYYFQIIAVNSQGTTYGEVLSFTAGAPTGVTKAATSVTSSTARLNGTVNRNNDSTGTAQICLSDGEDVGVDGSLVSCIQTLDVPSSQLVTLTSDDVVFTDVTDLVAGNTYFFQVKTTGANGVSIGEVLNFSTGYSVTFLANGGSGTMNDQSGTISSALIANSYSKSGATFAGWSLTSGGSLAYADGATYDFSANLTLYAIWSSSGTPAPTTVTKQKLKLTWTNPSPINFGTPLGGGQLNGVTDFPSVCVYTPAAGTLLAPGTYTLSVTCTPVNGSLYEPVTGTVTLEVKKVKGKPRIVWFNPSPITNPTPLSGTQLNAVASVPGTYQYNPAAGTVLAQGRHKLNVKFSPSNKDENEEIEANVTIDVLAPKAPNNSPSKPSETSTASNPVVAPIKPVSAPDTRTATTPALKPTLKTDGVVEVVTVKPNEEKTGIIVSSENWSLQIKSTTQFVQGTVEDTSARVVIEKGNTVTTSGTGFKPLSQVDVYVYSTPTWLGAVVTDEFGNFTTTLPMPNSLPEGDHTFQAQGLTPDDRARTAAVPITLVPATIVNKPGSMRFEVYFGMNSVVITKAEKAKTARMIKIAKSKIASGAKVSVEISGWVQPNPNPGNVKYLSTNRAKNVRDLVQSLGLKGSYTLKYPGLEKDNIPSARHASVIIKWSKSK
jgi:hypothetical protein